MLLLNFFATTEFLLSRFITPHQQSVKYVAVLHRGPAPKPGGAEFQSAPSCEQRAASRLRPLMPPGRTCAGWQERGHYVSQDAICQFVCDTCCYPKEARPVIKLRAVTLKYKADDLNGPVCVRNMNLHTVQKSINSCQTNVVVVFCLLFTKGLFEEIEETFWKNKSIHKDAKVVLLTVINRK